MGQMVWESNLVEARDFFLLQNVPTDSIVLPGVKMLGHEVNLSPWSSVSIKSEWGRTSIMPLWCEQRKLHLLIFVRYQLIFCPCLV